MRSRRPPRKPLTAKWRPSGASESGAEATALGRTGGAAAGYLDRLAEIKARQRPFSRDALHQALGAAKQDAGRDARFVQVDVQLHGESKTQTATLSWKLDRKTLRTAWRREGRYRR